MAINQVSGKKQQKLVRLSKFVAKANGKDRTRQLMSRSRLVEEGDDIEVDDTSSVFGVIINGDSPYQDRKAAMDLFYEQCLDFCEDGGRVFVTAVAVR